MNTSAAAIKKDQVIKAESRDLNFFYSNGMQALKSVSMPLYENKITALIGPSGCGKSTFLRCFNRMHDLYPGNKYQGQIVMQPDNTNILEAGVDPIEVRMRISMVFQKPNPFPKSIYELAEKKLLELPENYNALFVISYDRNTGKASATFREDSREIN